MSKFKKALFAMALFLTVSTFSTFAQGVIDVALCNRVYQGARVVNISLITNCKINLTVKNHLNHLVVNEEVNTRNKAILLPRGKYFVNYHVLSEFKGEGILLLPHFFCSIFSSSQSLFTTR